MDSQHHGEVDLMLAALEPEVSKCLSEKGGIQAGDQVPEIQNQNVGIVLSE